jgi:flagellar biosynthetic protein FliQ
MDASLAADLVRETLLVALKLVAPALLVGMVIGLLVSLFQALTSIQEQTLSLVPKMLAIAGTLLLLLPWIFQTLLEFTVELFQGMATFSR